MAVTNSAIGEWPVRLQSGRPAHLEGLAAVAVAVPTYTFRIRTRTSLPGALEMKTAESLHAESLHAEISPLGFRSLYFEPSYFRMSFLAQDHCSPYDSRIPDYAEMTRKTNETFLAYNGKQPGDPKKLVQILLDVVRGEGVSEGREVPLGLPLGSDSFDVIKDVLQRTDQVLEEWKDVIKSTDFLTDAQING